MATKMIEIEMDAYERLMKVRRDGESFSDTLKRVIWNPAPFEAGLERVRADPLSDEAVAAIEQVVEARGHPPRRPRRVR